MKNPWRNPLKPLLGCAALLTVIGAFLLLTPTTKSIIRVMTIVVQETTALLPMKTMLLHWFIAE